MESFYWKKLGSLNESAAITEAICDMSNVPYKKRINRINIVRVIFLSMPKKIKESPRTRLSGNKITWTETFVRSKKIRRIKNHLKRRDFSLLWGLANIPHLKKNLQYFLCVTVTSPFPPTSPQISCFRSLHHLYLNNSENTNYRHLPLTGTDHYTSRLSENSHL